MKRFTAAAAIALSLLGASVAMADGRHDHDEGHRWAGEHRDFENRRDNDRRDSGRDSREFRHDDGRDHWHERREWRDHDDHGWREGRSRYGDYGRDWGYREHDWRRGERLPIAYYAPPRVIGDYGVYGLHEPPYGCRWVRVNNDVVLTAIATGVVLEVAYNIF
jgi:Ni/Co efflux regulator RcnB